MNANEPTEESARKGYDELVSVISRRREGRHVLSFGTPKQMLVGLMLDNAQPVYIDPLAEPYFMVVGDDTGDTTFIAELLALRSKWVYPHDTLRSIPNGDTTNVYPWPSRGADIKAIGRRQGRYSVLLSGPLGTCATHRYSGRTPGSEVKFRGLLTRSATPPSGKFLTEAEAEWLPNARGMKAAGYIEAILCVNSWAKLPLAVAASTPEYEFLTAKLARPKLTA